jgi:hypothetical protein
MANNVTLTYRWSLEIEGLEQFLVQEAQLPEDGVETFKVNAGVNDYDKTLPSKATLGTLTLKKLIATDNTEVWAYEWLQKVKTKKFEEYAKFAFLKLLAEDGITVVRKYDLGEIFPIKVSPENANRLGTEAFMESVEFAISRFTVTTS